MDVLAEAQAIEAGGAKVIHMEVGEPAYGAPRAAREALTAAMGRGETFERGRSVIVASCG